MSIETQTTWLTTREAAQHLGCSVNFLATDRCTRRHGIPFARVGRVVRYDRVELDAWLKANRELDPARG